MNNTDNITFEQVDFSEYEFNNWKKVDDNRILNMVYKRGASVWLTSAGALSYRLSKDTPVLSLKNYRQANLVFSNYLDTKVSLLKEPGEDFNKAFTTANRGADVILTDEDIEPSHVSVKELKMVQADEFSPLVLEEFYKRDSLYYRNIFKPSNYLQMKEIEKGSNNLKFQAIQSLIKHIVNYDNDRYRYVINWLAYFFQGLKKSQVALVLRGNQGAGKGILFNEIIKPLFGEEYCKTVNDKSLRSSYLGGIVENVIFFNLDEISHQKAESTNIKNFLKALVTNETITAEKKFITLDNETKIFGQVLITSNEPYVLDVEESDRRYTIFTTGDNLQYNGFLGYVTYGGLSKQIKEELKSFAKYLKTIEVDVPLANKALPTPEKEELQRIQMHKEMEKRQRIQESMQVVKPIKIPDPIMKFAYAIRTKNKSHFIDLKFEQEALYTDLLEDFEQNRIKIKNLLLSFQLLHGDELRVRYVSILLKELRKFDPYQFSDMFYKEIKTEDERIDYISIVPYSYNLA